MVHAFEVWIQLLAPDRRRGWLLTRGDHYAADAARLPNDARLAWAGEATEAEAKRRLEVMMGLRKDSDDENGQAVAAT